MEAERCAGGSRLAIPRVMKRAYSAARIGLLAVSVLTVTLAATACAAPMETEGEQSGAMATNAATTVSPASRCARALKPAPELPAAQCADFTRDEEATLKALSGFWKKAPKAVCIWSEEWLEELGVRTPLGNHYDRDEDIVFLDRDRNAATPRVISDWALAHEQGHALQLANLPPAIARGAVTQAYEQQATCLAGVFFGAQALAGDASALWDYQFPDSDGHGTTAQNRAALQRGFDRAKAAAETACGEDRAAATRWAFDVACPLSAFGGTSP